MTRDILFMATIREIGDTDRELRLTWQPVDVSHDVSQDGIYENSIREKRGKGCGSLHRSAASTCIYVSARVRNYVSIYDACCTCDIGMCAILLFPVILHHVTSPDFPTKHTFVARVCALGRSRVEFLFGVDRVYHCRYQFSIIIYDDVYIYI